MLKLKTAQIPTKIQKLFKQLLKLDKQLFTIIPIEGINSKYYSKQVLNEFIKISFIFSKRIFYDDNIYIEPNDIFPEFIIVDSKLSNWFNNWFQNYQENWFRKNHINYSPEILLYDSVFDLFLDLMYHISSGSRDFDGDNKFIHESARIYHGVCIGNNVYIGPGTIIYPNVVIYDNVYIESNVVIHSGSIIGADGFGYTDSLVKIPQEGGVVIKSNVEIGACTCIDRATIGYTYIGENTKVDNIVQIGHNVKIAKNCRIAGKSGIAGSVRIYDNSIIAAMSGVKDGIRIGPNSILAGASMATKTIPPNQIFAGNPARPFNQYFRDIVKRS